MVMSVDERLALIKRNTDEIIGEEELKEMLKRGEKLKHYIGFEISGKVHLGTGIVCMSKVKDFMEAGVDCSIFLADWHTWINDKLGGNPETIKKIAVGYFKEALKASLKCSGGNPEKLKFILGSDLYSKNDLYWTTVIEISKHTSLSRMLRSITIMGREEGEAVDFAKLIYPPMQVADIFIQRINLAHGGLDQRKAQVIARDVALKLSFSPLINKEGKQIKPIAIHSHLLLGLGQPPMWPVSKDNMQEVWSALKMSKSKPDTCIFIHDSPTEIKRKIEKAFCPEGEIEFNPVLDWCKYVVFPIKKRLEIIREKKFGGNLKFDNYTELEKIYKEKKLHPLDLKKSVTESLIEILEPARKHFSQGNPKQMLEEIEKLIIVQ